MRYRGRFRSSCEEDPRPIEEKKKAEGPSSRYLDTPGRRMKEGKDRTIRTVRTLSVAVFLGMDIAVRTLSVAVGLGMDIAVRTLSVAVGLGMDIAV
ncbi:hypothetical protein RRG08_050033 [Elysia crispata]|uniref:Uncharacterized protein n=1 Tax=Elysia crispata TaxID=231223 RepID=A0AAE1B9P6_9GAST|nr:hypothetical protein RRG08_050033 [Elysia crispata]